MTNSLYLQKKNADFTLFKMVIALMNMKQHLTMKGLQEIVNIRATMNNGLSDKLEKALPETIPVKRPEVDNIEIRNPQWLYGFSAWRLFFLVSTSANKNNPDKPQIRLHFSLSQNSLSHKLLESLVNYLGCGYTYNYS